MILLGRFLKVSQFSPLESSSSLVDIGPSSVDTSVGETVVAPGIGLGLGVTLSKVADTAIGVWAVDTSVGETIVAPGIRLGFGITLAKVVTIVWAGVGTSVGVGETVAHIGIGLGLSLALSKVKSRGDNMVDSSNTGVKERRVSLSISCGSKGQSSNK